MRCLIIISILLGTSLVPFTATAQVAPTPVATSPVCDDAVDCRFRRIDRELLTRRGQLEAAEAELKAAKAERAALEAAQAALRGCQKAQTPSAATQRMLDWHKKYRNRLAPGQRRAVQRMVSKALKAVRADVKANRKALDAFKAEVTVIHDGFEQRLTALETRVGDLEISVDDHEDRIHVLEREMDDVQEAVSNLQSVAIQQNDRIDAIEARLWRGWWDVRFSITSDGFPGGFTTMGMQREVADGLVFLRGGMRAGATMVEDTFFFGPALAALVGNDFVRGGLDLALDINVGAGTVDLTPGALLEVGPDFFHGVVGVNPTAIVAQESSEAEWRQAARFSLGVGGVF